jgi:hypothetical protein
MNRDTENPQPSKAPYDPPRLRTIELAADEVLATGCKTAGGGGTVPGPIPCSANGCVNIGS